MVPSWENGSTRRETCHRDTLPTTNSTRTGQGLEPSPAVRVRPFRRLLLRFAKCSINFSLWDTDMCPNVRSFRQAPCAETAATRLGIHLPKLAKDRDYIAHVNYKMERCVTYVS
jgi:hypothetical protein